MFNAIHNTCQSYYDGLPTDGWKTIGFNTVLSFTASALIILASTPLNDTSSLSFARAATASGIALLVTTIHVLTTPMFNYIFDKPQDEFNGFEKLFRWVFDITLTHILINHFTATKVNVFRGDFFKNERFCIMPTHLIKIWADAWTRGMEWFSPGFTPSAHTDFKKYCGIDLDQNSTPIYVVI